MQADALEHALIAALPLGPQSAAGGISLPDSFHGELQVCHCCVKLEAALVAIRQFWVQEGSYMAPMRLSCAGDSTGSPEPSGVGFPLAEQPVLPPHSGLSSGSQQKR